jgi:phenylalanyl-tRNA synthetase beta chain
MLHPGLEHKFDLTGSCYLFEIQVNNLLDGVLPEFAPLSKLPSIRRDIAIVVDQKVEFSEVAATIRAVIPDILQDILLFDVYTGEKVDSGLKSLALGLILQETSHTLTDQDVEEVMGSVLQKLQQELNAQLRD